MELSFFVKISLIQGKLRCHMWVLWEAKAKKGF